MICQQCNVVDYMVEDTINGSYVCTNCGEMLKEQMMSDEAMYDKATDDWSHSTCNSLKPMGGMYGYMSQDNNAQQEDNFRRILSQIVDYHHHQFPQSFEHDIIIYYKEFKKKYSMQGRSLENMIYAFIVITHQKYNVPLQIIITPDITKCLKFIEQNFTFPKESIINPVLEGFYDADIEANIRKYKRTAELTKNNIKEINALIQSTEFIMRSKEIIALGLIVVYKKSNDRHWMKLLAKEACVSELAIKSAVKDIKSAL